MTQARIVRRTAPIAAFALAAACAGPTEPLVPSMAVSPTPTAVGQLIICKAANASGSFNYSWSITNEIGSGVHSAGTQTVAAGECELATSIPTSTSLQVRVSVTEDPLPANWSLTSITPVFSHGVGITPVVDLSSRNISNVRLNHDVSVTLTFTNEFTPPPPEFCTLTQGYWKNHAEDWDNAGENYVTTGDTFYNSGASYLAILGMSAAGGNAYLQLAHQFIAASLNVQGLSGSGVPEVDAALAGADAAFSGWAAGTAGPAKKTATRAQWLAWADVLDAFNNGATGPGHCDD